MNHTTKLTISLRMVGVFLTVLLCHSSLLLAQEKKGEQTPQVMSQCLDPYWKPTAVFNSNGCYWDVTYFYDWLGIGTLNNTHTCALPHGIRVAVGGSTITSATMINAAGWSGYVSTLVNPTTFEWKKPVPTQCAQNNHPSGANSSNAVPSAQNIIMRVYVTPSSGSGTLTLGLACLINQTVDYPFCQRSFSSSRPTKGLTLKHDTLCSDNNNSTILQLGPSGSFDPSKVKWYKYEGQPCPNVDPPNAPWVLVPQQGGAQHPTGSLTQTTCYVAVVDEGCFTYMSNVATVFVCEKLSTVGGIVSAPATGSQQLQQIPGLPGWHACGSWSGTLSIAYNTSSCQTNIKWYSSLDGGITWSPIGSNNTSISVGPLNAPTNRRYCFNRYSYKAVVKNECGEQPVGPYHIYLDRPITSKDVKLEGMTWENYEAGSQQWCSSVLPCPPPPTTGNALCNGSSAVIQVRKNCDQIRIVEWQVLKWTNAGVPPSSTDPNWTPLPGAGGTPEYFTNILSNPNPSIQSVWYRVRITNGACPTAPGEVWSEPYEIRVKPALTVDLTTNKDMLCAPPLQAGSATLTASSNIPGVTYTWFLDGSWIAGPTTNPQLTVSNPGYYYVFAKDKQCNDSAKSNIVTICAKPVVVVDGPCGICRGETIDLKALVASYPDGCTSGCVINWSGPGGFTATGQTVTVSEAGTYNVWVTCVTPKGVSCTAKTSHTVVRCPEF